MMGYRLTHVLVERDHLFRGLFFAFSLEIIDPVLVELARCGIQPEKDILAGLVTGLLDGLQDDLNGLLVRFQVRSKAPFVSHRGVVTLFLKNSLQRMKNLGTDAYRLGAGRSAGGNDHELLDIDIVVRVRAAVQHVHHGNRQFLGIRAAEVMVQRQVCIFRRGLGHGKGNGKHGIRAEFALVFGTVDLDHGPVDHRLLNGIHAHDRGTDHLDHVVHRVLDTLAKVARTAVSELKRFALAR